ncbi:beta-N-acetylhexosaminidase [Kribbella sandramycini]|uniref:Beta-N-acetylhexosaminidase n=1 Tax=Kribbella sandramycini TaxID=60450 RepID=A0A7Y4KXR9_9ACTN|nr:beta-N-acetylglucosaminidase domain-containing protein [Kribbella sandramycini]MBB6569547.1 hyaluronoglucosaminidase [Kribbella sandramycini]NOL40619.1 beta-N-acetylhexosaminidase [Kribbella sandramycini]
MTMTLGATVVLRHGPTTDPDAERVLRAALTAAGVEIGAAGPTIWLGGSDEALARLGAEPARGLPAEGYVVAIGPGDIVLHGADPRGTFYAAQTFAQLVDGNELPELELRDAPALRYRGSIEGFYGTPWSHADRLDHLDYLGAHRLNTFQYAPKDDPYHRELWRDPYPAAKLAELAELIERAARNKVDFTFALSPGLSVRYDDDADHQALIAKFDALYAVGARVFNVPLDDIDYGADGGAAGRQQAALLNRIQREWVAAKPGVAPLQMVPTEYYDALETPYKQALREHLDPAVVVHWTGTAVIPERITAEQAAEAKAVFGHDILIWDNFPVNDYVPGRLLLGAYSGREPGVADHIVGVISNPMNQARTSKLALHSFADYGWSPATYDEQASWLRAIAELAAGDADIIAALMLFADLNTYDGTLHHTQSPVLAAEIANFWSAGAGPDAAAALRGVFEAIEQTPAVLRGTPIAAETASWLDATELWGRALQRALDLLEQVASGNDAADGTRAELTELVARATAIRDHTTPHSETYPRIADGVADLFVIEAGRAHDRARGLPTVRTASSSQPAAGRHAVNHILDGDPATFFSTSSPPAIDDEIRVDLGAEYDVATVTLLMAEPTSPDDYIHSGVLEISHDTVSWAEITRATTPDVQVVVGAKARYVRYRALAANAERWLVVRTFDIRTG